VTFPAFKAGDSTLRGSNGGFDFHTPPPIMLDEQYTSVRSVCVNEKKLQDPGSNPEPAARGIANPTERNVHPKPHPPNPRVGHPRCDSILLPSELQEWGADQQSVYQNQDRMPSGPPGLQSRRFDPSRVEWWIRLPHAFAKLRNKDEEKTHPLQKAQRVGHPRRLISAFRCATRG
jgi:hypothetical protein